MKKFTIYFSGSTDITATDEDTAVATFWKTINDDLALPLNLYNIENVELDGVEVKKDNDEET